MLKFAAAAILVSLVTAAPADAEDHPVVVELFTSQGCSSCPPADELMRDLSQRDDVIGLALHVDYWDYIGWKDLFAKPAHTQRQKAYAREGGRAMIYTPQMIVNGQADVAGSDGLEVMGLIAEYHSAAQVATVVAERSGSELGVKVTPLDLSGDETYEVQLVQYSPLRHAAIERGELAGQEFNYANVVESWQVLGQWDGTTTATFTATLDPALSAAVLVQRAGQGPIVAATRAD
ncbi:hypothetical protein AVO45_06660 [Ruegeria marisrubri]|uniref:DUF1223 domain-containing protein n=1 Tax=Ruegeria marisrubri TaxID=1685379 RepID=A0A0X3TYC1_9RHOB|nr:DUF1223 domain-containing protein [Ruegeria marisrubri]KUJ80708.1 hypothetical protein AVO45_06660 [Ruegeria marisrubri]